MTELKLAVEVAGMFPVYSTERIGSVPTGGYITVNMTLIDCCRVSTKLPLESVSVSSADGTTKEVLANAGFANLADTSTLDKADPSKFTSVPLTAHVAITYSVLSLSKKQNNHKLLSADLRRYF